MTARGEARVIAEEVLSAPPTERHALLVQLCGDRSELRAEVERLLEGEELSATISFADPRVEAASPTTRTVPADAESAPPGGVPKRIGRYVILERIGEGGMGTVYAARQTSPVRRRVAIKLIRAGIDRKEILARFEAEHQALARMSHPNIARIFDAGSTEDGAPYFVMEYVPGIPITDFCDRNKLSFRERLELFVAICHAVQHAHQKGVIHRDLKPSNILVVRDGESIFPKIIDFGVAKAMAEPLTERTLYTEVGRVIGTVEYMSPEQADPTAIDIDTRSDVYSLGVVLYELLTGTLPFDSRELRRAGLAEIQRVLREVDPAKPSTRLGSTDTEPSTATRRSTDLRSLIRRVRGDLDWITMKCLEKNPTRRYASAAAIAEDIERYFRSEPVAAGPPSLQYRVAKLYRRHRAAAWSVTAVAAAFLIGFVAVFLSLRSTQAERDRADRQRETFLLETWRLKSEQLVARGELMPALAYRLGILKVGGTREDLDVACDLRRRTGRLLWTTPSLDSLDSPVESDNLPTTMIDFVDAFGTSGEAGLVTGGLVQGSEEPSIESIAWDLSEGRPIQRALSIGDDASARGKYLHGATSTRVLEIQREPGGTRTCRLRTPAGRVVQEFQLSRVVEAAAEHGIRINRGLTHLLEEGEEDGVLRVAVWDTERGERTRSIPVPAARHRDFAIDGEGRAVAIVSAGERTATVALWEYEDSVSRWKIDASAWPHFRSRRVVESVDVEFNEGGSRVVLRVDTEEARWHAVIDRATGEFVWSVPGAWRVVVSPDGGTLAVERDETIRVADLANPDREVSIPGEDAVDVRFGTSADRLTVTGERGSVRIYDRWTGSLLARLQGHRGRVDAAQLLDADTRLVSGGWDDSTVRMWQPPGLGWLAAHAWLDGQSSAVYDESAGRLLALFPDDRILSCTAASESDSSESQESSEREWLPFGSQIVDLALAGARDLLAVSAVEGSVDVFDLRTKKRRTSISLAPLESYEVDLDPEGRWLAARSLEHFQIMDLRSLQSERHDFEGAVGPRAFHADGRLVVVEFGKPARVHIWSPETKSFVSAWEVPTDRLRVVPAASLGVNEVGVSSSEMSNDLSREAPSVATWSPDGRMVAVAFSSGTVMIWDTRTGELRSHFATPEPRRLAAVAIDRAGEAVVVFDRAGGAHGWLLESGRPYLGAGRQFSVSWKLQGSSYTQVDIPIYGGWSLVDDPAVLPFTVSREELALRAAWENARGQGSREARERLIEIVSRMERDLGVRTNPATGEAEILPTPSPAFEGTEDADRCH